MTDKEIIKALEGCGSGSGGCKQCPMFEDCRKDIHALEKYALDLINRQQAEIEYLKKVIETMTNEQILSATEAKKEIDRLIDEIDELNIEIAKLYFKKDKAKAEAIKEFVERLKKRMGYCDLPIVIVRHHIDNLVKEMVGDAE